MKNKIISIICIIISILIIILIMIGLFNTKQETNYIEEEAIPIREESIITSMDYIINISSKEKKDNLTIKSSIIDSIYHYKDINNIETFPINIKINNNSNYNYLLKDIRLINDNKYEDISFKMYGNNISILLKKDYFKVGNKIELKLER